MNEKPISDESKITNSSEEQSSPNKSTKTTESPPIKAKPPKPEDKPFNEFISEYFIPNLNKALEQNNNPKTLLSLVFGERPVVGGDCHMVVAKMQNGRRFWICFSNDKLTSAKSIVLAEKGAEPSLIESFLIDEKKTTLSLLISRVLQRLNGQKWLGAN